ncbi:hypothetical protein A3D83_01095 [Candidatus Daviesbacteria bacterium RIFCSPHIGHO2_02_FULL_41_10]|uniref:Membrane protein 6-pyruvoyl-tetrahydropterin synthase-related domain-containing protein n=1 Tax=Candidatus Daviesbacteria bacterium RIFCSPHIGHO2_02_FULL_41_10 TaxID=1797774 RepID=A0A1F5JY28_9BACT|nr:MAG: hypothetical protein A3D83_01095 [Candidatus Daviesbacteria bacterium RIFCSPHIGHO2_02_FULL_41_10]
MKALFHPGLFTAHDIWHQVARLYYYSEAFSDGVFPPYWVSTLAGGFGYPLFFFSYHMPWILGLPFLGIGLDIPTTLKVLFFLSFLLSGLFMYLFMNNLLRSKFPALLSAIMYLWAPYHFLTIFVGASMGIVFVFTFLPLLLLGILLVKDAKNSGVPVFASGLTGIILSHLEHVLFLSPIILIFTIWGFTETKYKILFLRNMLFGLVLGLSLSAFYLIPAGYYNQFTKIHSEAGFSELYKRNFVNLSQIIYSKWGYGPIVDNAKNGEMSVQLGIAQWLSFLGVVILLLTRKLQKQFAKLTLFAMAGFFISIFLMLDFSLPIWQIIEKIIALDYPFRELLSLTFIGSAFSGILLISFGKKIQYVIFALITIAALYTNRNHIKVNLYTDIPVHSYVESEITTNSFNEYLPITADGKLLGQPVSIAEGDKLAVSNIKQSTDELSFTINAPTATSVSVKQFYFPGQTLYVNNNKYSYEPDKQGKINFQSPPGFSSVSVKFEDTTIIKISKITTLLGIAIWLFMSIKAIKLRRE